MLFIAVWSGLTTLWRPFPGSFSTVAWALTYGALADISAKSIWKARQRGDKKIPIAIGVGVLILTVGIIIGGIVITVEENKAKVARLETARRAEADREKVAQDIVSKLPGEWHGTADNNAANLFITKADGQLSGKMIYNKIEQNLSVNVQFEKNEPIITLKGVSYKRLIRGRGSFSLDTFYGILSNDGRSITGNYEDARGHQGKWSVSRVSGNTMSSEVPPETTTPVNRTEPSIPQGKDPLASGITIKVPATKPWTNSGVQVDAGQILKITATGSVNTLDKKPRKSSEAQWWKWVGPEGWGSIPRFERRHIHLLPEGKSYMGLIGKIGEEGKPFFIGKYYEGQLNQSGILYLGINDIMRDEFGKPHGEGDPWWTNNQGEFRVNIYFPTDHGANKPNEPGSIPSLQNESSAIPQGEAVSPKSSGELPQTEIQHKVPENKSWVNKGIGVFVDWNSKSVYGVGAMSGVKNKALMTITVDNRAKEMIGVALHYYVTFLIKDYLSYVNEQWEKRFIKQNNKDVVRKSLEGLEFLTKNSKVIDKKAKEIISEAVVIDHLTDPNDGSFYSLAFLEMAKFKQKLGQIEELSAEVLDFAQKNEEKIFNQIEQKLRSTPSPKNR